LTKRVSVKKVDERRTQQLLFLPYISKNPSPLPFRVTHVFLAATLPSPSFFTEYPGKYGLPFNRMSISKKELTTEEKKAIVRPTIEKTFDPAWLEDPSNSKRFEELLERMIVGRPMRTIMMQGKAITSFSFGTLHSQLRPPPLGPAILIIHGHLDTVVPYFCAEDLLRLIPHARMVEVGPLPGQVESLEFGHNWFEYYDAEKWSLVLEKFIEEGQEDHQRARL